MLDDLLATGGTVEAAGKLIEKTGGMVVECHFIIELVALKGRERVKYPIYSMVTFTDK